MAKILLLDNYDSFTYNLYHQIEKISNADIDVIRNDEVDLMEVNKYDVFVLSPGPKLPKDAGYMMKLIDYYYMYKPIIGICLGMQGIAEYFGSELDLLNFPEHGQSKKMKVIESSPLFENCPQEFLVGRYHSWGVKKQKLSDLLLPLSIAKDNWIMSFRHIKYKIIGIQYHPESVLTEFGDEVMSNALKFCGI
ncbi:MAG: aminodeoxychorismate/anthranilate synthase component II [Bacteroidia bacterium]|nr:aminodeoxychorismate/anthranilate synthase component II [Bacteroidia bacterium]